MVGGGVVYDGAKEQDAVSSSLSSDADPRVPS